MLANYGIGHGCPVLACGGYKVLDESLPGLQRHAVGGAAPLVMYWRQLQDHYKSIEYSRGQDG
jgi:hypothetical protein